jgi:hypothetical protein
MYSKLHLIFMDEHKSLNYLGTHRLFTLQNFSTILLNDVHMML